MHPTVAELVNNLLAEEAVELPGRNLDVVASRLVQKWSKDYEGITFNAVRRELGKAKESGRLVEWSKNGRTHGFRTLMKGECPHDVKKAANLRARTRRKHDLQRKPRYRNERTIKTVVVAKAA